MKQFLDRALNRAYWLKQRASYLLFPDRIDQTVPAIAEESKPASGKRIGHIAMYTNGNAGDTLLPCTVRDVFDEDLSHHWEGIHVHRPVNKKLLAEINQLDGVLIGGGGLFLRDTNPNNFSGWQWSCSVDALSKIEVPLALFAVGYNRFRGQADFKPIFREHLALLASKSVYIGLRNSGSIRELKSYLPKELHQKLRFQPCPTTLCSYLYPQLCNRKEEDCKKPLIALNCAFDRIDLRLKNRTDAILSAFASAIKELSASYSIAYYAHAKSDLQMLPFLDKAGVSYRLEKLYYVHPREVIKAYARPRLVLGMRGHAQMIPFGCRTPILSLISHDKMKWFLEDIQRLEWGVEMQEADFKTQLIDRAERLMNQQDEIRDDICSIQKRWLEITRSNVTDFSGRI